MVFRTFAASCLCALSVGMVFSTTASAAPAQRNISLWLGSRQVARSIPSIEDRSGEIYAPALDAINSAFGSALTYQSDLDLVNGIGADGAPVSLAVAPSPLQAQRRHLAFGAGLQVWVPLRTLAGLMNLSFDLSPAGDQVTMMPRLSSVTVVPVDRTVRIELHGSAPFGFVKVSYYDNPWRIVLDVNGVRTSPGQQRPLIGGVSDVRWQEWPSPGKVRIVAQLTSRLPFSVAASGRPSEYWLDVSQSGASNVPIAPRAPGAGHEFGGATPPWTPVTPPPYTGTTPPFTVTTPPGTVAAGNILPPAPVVLVPTDHTQSTAPGIGSTGAETNPLPPDVSGSPLEAPIEIKDIASRKVDRHTTELTISATGPIACHSSFYDSPSRLVLDIPHSTLKLLSPDLIVGGPGIRRVRTGGFPRNTQNSRIVLDLTSRSLFQVLSEQDRSLIRILVREMQPTPMGSGVSPVAGHTICIDPGHCDVFHGAHGLYGLKEEEVTLSVGLRLEQLLTAAGANVVMTRHTGAPPSGGGGGLLADLISRADIANRAHADLFLSIHCDAMPNHTGIGSQTIYGQPRSKTWALCVYHALLDGMGHGGTGLHFRPQIKVTEYTDMPSTLAELGFIDNSVDADKLVDPSFRQREAEILFRAFECYYSGTDYTPVRLIPNVPIFPDTPVVASSRAPGN